MSIPPGITPGRVQPWILALLWWLLVVAAAWVAGANVGHCLFSAQAAVLLGLALVLSRSGAVRDFFRSLAPQAAALLFVVSVLPWEAQLADNVRATYPLLSWRMYTLPFPPADFAEIEVERESGARSTVPFNDISAYAAARALFNHFERPAINWLRLPEEVRTDFPGFQLRVLADRLAVRDPDDPPVKFHLRLVRCGRCPETGVMQMMRGSWHEVAVEGEAMP